MAISPHDIRARQFATVKRGGYDQREVEAFRTAAAEALEHATQEATAMEARARAAVARLQELQQQPAAQPADAGPGAVAQRAVAPDEAETISRTLLLAQRTADATVADAEREANEIKALLARRDFLESDVDQLDQFLAAQRDRITAVAAALNDVTTRVGNGLGPMRRPQLSASDSDHSGETIGEGVAAAAVDEVTDDSDAVDEPDVAELIEQVGSAGPSNEHQ
jgi:DivIVA domain-containing protein